MAREAKHRPTRGTPTGDAGKGPNGAKGTAAPPAGERRAGLSEANPRGPKTTGPRWRRRPAAIRGGKRSRRVGARNGGAGRTAAARRADGMRGGPRGRRPRHSGTRRREQPPPARPKQRPKPHRRAAHPGGDPPKTNLLNPRPPSEVRPTATPTAAEPTTTAPAASLRRRFPVVGKTSCRRQNVA